MFIYYTFLCQVIKSCYNKVCDLLSLCLCFCCVTCPHFNTEFTRNQNLDVKFSSKIKAAIRHLCMRASFFMIMIGHFQVIPVGKNLGTYSTTSMELCICVFKVRAWLMETSTGRCPQHRYAIQINRTLELLRLQSCTALNQVLCCCSLTLNFRTKHCLSIC